MSDGFDIAYAADQTTPVSYRCTELLENNQATEVEVVYYYDLLRKRTDAIDDVLAASKKDLMESVASEYGLLDGARCVLPPINQLWVVQVDSELADEHISDFDSCLELEPNDEQVCDVYKGTLTAYYLGSGNDEDVETFVQTSLGSKGGPNTYQQLYLGTQLDTSALAASNAEDNLEPALSRAEAPAEPGQQERKVSVVGGLLVAGFLAAFLALFFVLYRRRQQFLAAQDVELALSKSDLDDNRSPHHDQQDQESTARSKRSDEVGEGSHDEDDYPSGNYTFDLGASMKNELFNIHGRAPSQPRNYNNINIEETSDSDADSWAQTDGTIGSLELQLEPITAEV